METKQVEEAYVACVMHDTNNAILYPVAPQDIRDTELREWYSKAMDLLAAGKDVDYVTVGGNQRLVDIMMNVPSSMHAETYAGKIKMAAYQRRLEQYGTRLVNIARNSENPRADAAQVYAELNTDSYTEQSTESISKWASRAWDRYEHKESSLVLSSGMTPVDRVVGYFRPGVTLIGGVPGSGKSMLLQRIMRGFCEKGHPGVFYSLEMTEAQFMDRVMSAESGVPVSRLSVGDLSAEEWKSMPHALERIEKWSMFVSDGAWDTDKVRADLIKMKADHQVEWFAIDYLERLRDKTGGLQKWERTEAIGRKLIDIAKDLGLVGVVVQKLNKDGWEGVADMADFSGGSDLAYDAVSMVVLAPHTPKTGESLPNMRTLINIKPNRLTEQYSRFGHLVKNDSLPIILPEEKFGG